MADADHKFDIKTKPGLNTSDPNDLSLLQKLTVGLQGGDATFDYFAGNIEALNNIYQTIATGGDTVWLDGTDENDNPVQYVDNGGHFLSVGSVIHDQDAIKNGTGDTKTYKEVGTAYVTLTTDQGTSIQLLSTIRYAGLGIAGIGISIPLLKILKPIVKSVVSFIKNLCLKIYNKVKGGDAPPPDEAEGDVGEDAGVAAEEAGEEGAEVAEGIFADVAFGLADAVGVVVAVGAIAVVLILALLEKAITNYVKFYNATSIDVEFGLCWAKSATGVKVAPAKVGDTIEVKKISAAPTPPWVTSSDTVIYRSDSQFINDNELKGIGYVMQAKPAGDFPGFRIMVDIPNVGDNSMYVAFVDTDCESVWNDQKDQFTGTTSSATSGNYELRIATNQVSGKSPSPYDSAEGYNYEHLVVLTDGTVHI